MRGSSRFSYAALLGGGWRWRCCCGRCGCCVGLASAAVAFAEAKPGAGIVGAAGVARAPTPTPLGVRASRKAPELARAGVNAATTRSGVSHVNWRATRRFVLGSIMWTTRVSSSTASHVCVPSSCMTWKGWDSDGSWKTMTALMYRRAPCSDTLQMRRRRPSQRCAPAGVGTSGRVAGEATPADARAPRERPRDSSGTTAGRRPRPRPPPRPRPLIARHSNAARAWTNPARWKRARNHDISARRAAVLEMIAFQMIAWGSFFFRAAFARISL